LPQSKPIPEVLNQKIQSFLSQYTEYFREILVEKKLPIHNFSLFKPHNQFIGIDNQNIHFIFSFDNATRGMVHSTQNDLRDFGAVSMNDVISVCQRDLGFKGVYYFSIPTNLLNLQNIDVENTLRELSLKNFNQEVKLIRKITKPLYITRDKLETFIKSSSEEEFTKNILIPLFRQLGFEKIKQKGHEEKILEFGKDIRSLKLRLPTKHYLYFAVQVKKGKIDSSSSSENKNIANLLTQVRMMLESEIFDYDINRKTKVDHAFIVASGGITESARVFLEENLSSEGYRKIYFLEKDDILDLCSQYGLPIDIQQKIQLLE